MPKHMSIVGAHFSGTSLATQQIWRWHRHRYTNAEVLWVHGQSFISAFRFSLQVPISVGRKKIIWSTPLPLVETSYFSICWIKVCDFQVIISFVHFLFQDIHREVRKIAEFLDVDLTEDEVEQIVENTSFSNMKKESLGSKNEPNPLLHRMFRKGDHDWNRVFCLCQLLTHFPSPKSLCVFSSWIAISQIDIAS